jgi:G3E family GTPase
VAETFTFVDESGQSLSELARLDTMVTVVDAARFLEDFRQTENLKDKGLGATPEDERTLADLLVDQVEFADVIVLNKLDLVSDVERDRLRAILAGLNPSALILDSIRGEVPLRALLNTGRFDFQRAQAAPGWLAVLRGEERSEIEEYGVRSFVFRARRPFHPERLWAFLHTEGPKFLRAKGLFWVASRPTAIGLWSQAGRSATLEHSGRWYCASPKEEWPSDPEERAELERDWDPVFGDRGQELVFISLDQREAETRRALEACLVNDDELALGESAWRKWQDPLPAWPTETLDA